MPGVESVGKAVGITSQVYSEDLEVCLWLRCERHVFCSKCSMEVGVWWGGGGGGGGGVVCFPCPGMVGSAPQDLT